MLGTRVIVGVVLTVVALLVIGRGGYAFFAMMLLLGLIGLNEFYRLMRRYKPIALVGLAGMIGLACAVWWGDAEAVMGATAATLLLTFLVAMAPGPKPGVSVRVAMTMLGLFWVGWGIAFLMLIRQLDAGTTETIPWLTFTVVFGTWVGDTLAYFTGRYFGATPMAPRLSPKKTWEGFAGGFIGTILIVVLLGLYTPGASPLDSLVLGLVIGIVAPLGDLFESLLKRDVQIKDAGRLFPGHGGVLDRFDGLFFAAVAGYFVIVWMF